MVRTALVIAALPLGAVLLGQAPSRSTLRLVSSVEDTMLAGRVHDRYDEYVGEARVFGSQVLRQRSANGVETVFGALHPDAARIDTTPALSAADVVARVRATGVEPVATRAPELIVLPVDGGYRLAWLTYAIADADVVGLFVDARTGEEVRRFSTLQTQAAPTAAVGAGTGVLGDRKKMSASAIGGAFLATDVLRASSIVTLDLKRDHARALDIIFNYGPVTAADVATDTDNVWTDGAAVDAHAGIGFAYDYFFARFGRRGIDGQDRVLRVVVHPARRNDVGLLPANARDRLVTNAFWCPFYCGPDGFGILVLGDGLDRPSSVNGRFVDYFAGGFDVVAHEYTHAVTMWSSDMIYLDESGALNESFSDIMAVGAEHYLAATGRRARPANYVIAEDVYPSFLPGLDDGLRSLADPGRFGQPDHYSRRVGGSFDNGGVHTNSGIPNHAFYLAVEGGTNRTSGLAVQGVGAANRAQIERVFYRGFTTYLSLFPTFADARRATLQAAVDLYGEASPAYRAVRDAWTAVGVN